jgi:hypothetical protein
MYPNKIFEIFNLSTPLAISIFFDGKLHTCATRAFFGTIFPKMPHIHINFQNAPVFYLKKKKKHKNRKEKKSWPSYPKGFLGGFSHPHWPIGGCRTTPFRSDGSGYSHSVVVVVFFFFFFFFKKKKKNYIFCFK